MFFTAPLRQFDLALAFTEAAALCRRQIIMTTRAGHARLVFFRGHVVFGNRPAAGEALLIITFAEVVIDGNPAVEDKTLSLPQAVFAVDFLQVVQDAAL